MTWQSSLIDFCSAGNKQYFISDVNRLGVPGWKSDPEDPAS